MSLTPFFSANGISVGNLFNPTNVVLANGSITAGNTVSANYFIGNGALLTGIVAGTSYSNANVAAYLPNYQGKISNIDFRSTSPTAAAMIVTDRPLTLGGNTLSYVTVPDDANANVIAAELTNHGLGNVLISSGPDDHEWIFDHTGNLVLPGNTWSVYYANGTQVPLGAATSYSNADVSSYLASNSNVTILTTGNITGSYISGNGIATTTVAATPPANPEQGDIWIRSDTGVQYIYFTSGGNSQWAEMEAAQSFSNGSSTGGSYGNADVAAYLNTGTASNILPSANVTYDIGTSTRRWKDIWLANSTIHLGTANISETSGNLVLPANVMIGSQPVTSSSGVLALPSGTTIGGSLVQAPKISNVQIATASWVVKDDTAVALEGGYILINGSGFVTGATVAINATQSVSASVVSATQIRAQVGAQSAGSYVVYVVNPDGSVAILLNGLTYSGTPTWVTGSTLATQTSSQPISIQLSATGATTYSLTTGSVLPGNLTLSSSGLLSGTVSVDTPTVYSFSVDAIDTELQESPRTFSVTITIADLYFNQVSLLLPGTGTNNANNNTFLDSSTNAFAITRNGNPTQGTFSPYSPAGWSNYFDGTGDYLTATNNSSLLVGSGDFTLECWVNFSSLPAVSAIATLGGIWATGLYSYLAALVNNSGTYQLILYTSTDGSNVTTNIIGAWTPSLNSWNHVAIVRSSTTVTGYVNGSSIGSFSTSATFYNSSTTFKIGGVSGSEHLLNGYISNLRLVKGTAVYTGNFTPPTAALTAISGTSLLTCQSNRFVDNSTNNFAITAAGDTKVTNWAPFAPAATWSAGVNGGSAYFDGTGDFLTVPSNAAFQPATGDFSLEGWFYSQSTSVMTLFGTNYTGVSPNTYLIFTVNRTTSGTNVAGAINFGVSDDIVIGSNTQQFVNSTWNHVLACRTGTTLSLFLNGIRIATTANSTNITPNIQFEIGNTTSLNRPFNGYLSNIRMVKGSHPYNATQTTITVPTAPVTAIANTSLLLNATNAGITDAATRNVIETVGDAKISTAQSKWGGSSMSFDGTGDYLTASNNINLQLGTGNFTIEFWVYLGATGAARGFVGKGGASTGWLISATSSDTVQFTYGSSTITSTGTLAGSTWYHIAVVREGTGSNQTKIYINGTNDGTGTVSTDFNQTEVMYVGANRTGGDALNGYINDLRVTKGIARYTANFTPPTSAFPLQ